MKNANTTINPQDDLLAGMMNDDIDFNFPFEADSAAVSPVPVVEEGEIDLSLDDLDLSDLELELALPAQSTVKEEPYLSAAELAEVEKRAIVANEVPDELDGLFDESDIDSESLNLDAAVASVMNEVAGSEAAPAEEKPAAAEEKPKTPKKERTPTTERVTYENSRASQVLLSRLGETAFDQLVLEVGDLDVDPEELRKKQHKLLAELNMRPGADVTVSTQKKVAQKIVSLFTWLNTGGELNTVMHRTFKLLLTDGYISRGKAGNLYADLLKKPYSPGTASAQSGQMYKMLPQLRIAFLDERGRFIPNPESLILIKVKSDLFPDL